MTLTSQQSAAISTAVYLVGIGILMVTGFWWPGIMFVGGAGLLATGLLSGGGWYAINAAIWSFGIGLWALFDYNMLIFFGLLALTVVLSAFYKPPFLNKKPAVDNTLE